MSDDAETTTSAFPLTAQPLTHPPCAGVAATATAISHPKLSACRRAKPTQCRTRPARSHSRSRNPCARRSWRALHRWRRPTFSSCHRPRTETIHVPSGPNTHRFTTWAWPSITSRSTPLSRSQIRTVRSAPADAIDAPSGLNAQSVDHRRVAVERATFLAGRHVPDLHGLIRRGRGDQASVRADRAGPHRRGVAGRPSRRTSQPPRASCHCADNVRRAVQLTVSQILSVSSNDEVTMKLPSALTAQSVTPSVWPRRTCRIAPVAASQILTRRS